MGIVLLNSAYFRLCQNQLPSNAPLVKKMMVSTSEWSFCSLEKLKEKEDSFFFFFLSVSCRECENTYTLKCHKNINTLVISI